MQQSRFREELDTLPKFNKACPWKNIFLVY